MTCRPAASGYGSVAATRCTVAERQCRATTLDRFPSNGSRLASGGVRLSRRGFSVNSIATARRRAPRSLAAAAGRLQFTQRCSRLKQRDREIARVGSHAVQEASVELSRAWYPETHVFERAFRRRDVPEIMVSTTLPPIS